MSDFFYRAVRAFGFPAFFVSSAPVVIGSHRTNRRGAFIIAATHQSAYDIPLLMRHSKRLLDFVSIVEVFANPTVGWFYGSMNAFPLDRGKPDPATVRTILDRLSRGRVIAMFPEGRFCPGEQSVVYTRKIRSGIGRIAKLANVPIVPCVIVNSIAYRRFTSWFPFWATRYGVIYGNAIEPIGEAEEIEKRLINAFVDLHGELQSRMSHGHLARGSRADHGQDARGT